MGAGFNNGMDCFRIAEAGSRLKGVFAVSFEAVGSGGDACNSALGIGSVALTYLPLSDHEDGAVGFGQTQTRVEAG